MKYGKGTLTTVYDRVNFYRDVHDDPDVTFKREGDKITLINGDGTIINDKLIAKSEDAFDHKFDTYTPLKKQLNENQRIALEYLKEKSDIYRFITFRPFEAIMNLNQLDLTSEQKEAENAIGELSYKEQAQVLLAFGAWALEQEE